jgi:hypothetical protein
MTARTHGKWSEIKARVTNRLSRHLFALMRRALKAATPRAADRE